MSEHVRTPPEPRKHLRTQRVKARKGKQEVCYNLSCMFIEGDWSHGCGYGVYKS